jgi:hypothetical protein
MHEAMTIMVDPIDPAFRDYVAGTEFLFQESPFAVRLYRIQLRTIRHIRRCSNLLPSCHPATLFLQTMFLKTSWCSPCLCRVLAHTKMTGRDVACYVCCLRHKKLGGTPYGLL